MSKPVVLVSVANLREGDVAQMRQLRELMAGGEIADLVPSFPCVTCPVQANMLTGRLPREHGVVANGFFWRKRRRVEMWTSPNDCIERPQIWDLLWQHDSSLTSAVWFALHSKGCETNYVCTPAPIHNPDGSESLWCYTRPSRLYGQLRDKLGHFPLQHFWGPLANIEATAWIVDSAVEAARQFRPDFFYIYLPHLDYAAQRSGPDSPEAAAAVSELDEQIGRLAEGFHEAYPQKPLWIIAGEYAITPVDHVVYPNRVLRDAGLLTTRSDNPTELDLENSPAFALVDHQHSHVFVSHSDREIVDRVKDIFTGLEGIAEVIDRSGLAAYGLEHRRSGDVVLISSPNSWQAYYWWDDDSLAPPYARTVDIHHKPGYDPVELFIDRATRSIPLDATLVRGSHGAPARDRGQRTVLICSQPGLFPEKAIVDTDVFSIVLRQFGLQA